MAVAGFGEEDLEIGVKEHTLTVRGKKDAESAQPEYLYRGIATREFERRFRLDEYVRVTGANLKDGLLHVNLVREIPEEKKPQRIAITNSAG
jgi:molecular chaperone IbpA